MMRFTTSLALMLGFVAATASARSMRSMMLAGQPVGHPPPAPEGEAPEKDGDGAYKTKDDACAACKFYATGSCAMYKTCICHATNAFFGIAGIPEPSDTTNFHYACGNGGGGKYELCFKVSGTYMENFGDKVDPNNPKCPE